MAVGRWNYREVYCEFARSGPIWILKTFDGAASRAPLDARNRAWLERNGRSMRGLRSANGRQYKSGDNRAEKLQMIPDRR